MRIVEIKIVAVVLALGMLTSLALGWHFGYQAGVSDAWLAGSQQGQRVLMGAMGYVEQPTETQQE